MSERSRQPLSVLITTFNEEQMLAACLASVAWAEERVVIDSGSTDRTVSIAEQMGAKVLQHPYESPARQKNWGLERMTHDWVLILDADEQVTAELAHELQRMLSGSLERDGYWIRRENLFLGRVVRHGGWESDRVIRLVRRERARYDDRLVHEEIDLPGPLPTLRHPLRHDTFRSFEQYWPKVERYSRDGALDAWRRGDRASAASVLGHSSARFFKMYLLRRGFLDGGPGLVLAMFSAFSSFLKYARLWEMGRRS